VYLPFRTTHSRRPVGLSPARIDHIFVRCGDDDLPTLNMSACELAFAEPHDGIYASDHFGLVADLAPPT
jgi:endonuclease/exonuclease/phosphatase family metal-dependent hydrolase